MKLTIKNVRFTDINGIDNLYLTVEESLHDIWNSTPEYENTKIFDEGTSKEATLWVKIWDCGIARFGYTMKSDPLHGNSEYTWSSNTGCINGTFNLYNTKYELARYGCGIKEDTDKGCYYAGELTKALALLIAQNNESKLHYGIEKYKETISNI